MYKFNAAEVKEKIRRAGLSLRKLAKIAGVDFKTAQKASTGGKVNEGSALRILDALGDDLSLTEIKKGD